MSGIAFALFDTPVGRCGVAWSERGVTAMQLPEADDAATRARLLKRHPDAVEAKPSGAGRQAIETAGNQGMATAGSGDVLAGILGALLSKGMEPYDAALLGVHLHAMAGDEAAGRLSVEALTATDILASVPAAIARLLAT